MTRPALWSRDRRHRSSSRSTGPSRARSARSPGGSRRSRPRSRSGGGALRRALKWLIGIGAVVAVLLIVAAIAVPRLIDNAHVWELYAGRAMQSNARDEK